MAAASRREPRRRPRRAQPARRQPGQPPRRPLPRVRRRRLPGGLPAVRRRARAVHPVPVHRAGPAQRGRRADLPGRPRAAVLGHPRRSRRGQPVADLDPAVRVGRLPHRQPAHPRDPLAAARARAAARHVRRAPHLRHHRPAGVRRRLRRGRVLGEVPLRPAARPRLAGLLHRLGGRGAAPVDGRADPARRAAGPGRLARHHDRADARLADPADRPVRSLVHPPR